jgi:hypothetical protein
MTRKRHHLNISTLAGEALTEVKQLLESHPGFLHTATSSVVIEFLCAHYVEGVALTKFKPKTKWGRPAGMNVYENMRPSHVRQAAGLTKNEARIGPELDNR